MTHYQGKKGGKKVLIECYKRATALLSWLLGP